MKKLIPLLTTVIVGACIGPVAHAFIIFETASTSIAVEEPMGDKTATIIGYMNENICPALISTSTNLLNDNAKGWYNTSSANGGQGFLTKTILQSFTTTKLTDMKGALTSALDGATAANCVANMTLTCASPVLVAADTVGAGEIINSAGRYHVRCVAQLPDGHCAPTKLQHTEFIMNVVDNGSNGQTPTACTYSVDYGQVSDDSDDTATKAGLIAAGHLAGVGITLTEVKDFVREDQVIAESNDN
jgi:hypothetical protein